MKHFSLLLSTNDWSFGLSYWSSTESTKSYFNSLVVHCICIIKGLVEIYAIDPKTIFYFNKDLCKKVENLDHIPFFVLEFFFLGLLLLYALLNKKHLLFIQQWNKFFNRSFSNQELFSGGFFFRENFFRRFICRGLFSKVFLLELIFNHLFFIFLMTAEN